MLLKVFTTLSPGSLIAVQKLRFTLSVRGLYTSYQHQCRENVVSESSHKTEEQGIPYSRLSVGVPKESWRNERRVALSPAATSVLIKKGFKVNIEENAGVESKFSNTDFESAGAKITNEAIAFESDIVLKVRSPSASEVGKFRDSATLLSFLYPGQNADLVKVLADRHMNVFAMDCIPRISRAQVFDALSSMANIAGYKAVVEAANNFGRFFTGDIHNNAFYLPSVI